MKNDKMQNMNEMMSKMPESERMMMGTRMCICHDCSTMTSCMTDPAMVAKMGGLFCGISVEWKEK